MKLWDKGLHLNKQIEKFTIGNDYLLDQKLLKYDCLGSIAHAKMLNKIGILNSDECKKIITVLNEIISLESKGNFSINQEDEDSHTAIEKYLTKTYGYLKGAKKINFEEFSSKDNLLENKELEEYLEKRGFLR